MNANTSNCVFCRIAADGVDSLGNPFVYQDDTFFMISDRSPHAPHHYLVIPKEHMKSANTLDKEHVELVSSMQMCGVDYLSKQFESKGEPLDASQLRVGFHWPPLISVAHLHMHILYPANQMSWFSRNMLFRDSRFFRSPERVIADLQARL